MKFGDIIAILVIWTIIAMAFSKFEQRVSTQAPAVAPMAQALKIQTQVNDLMDQGKFVQACAMQKIVNNLLSVTQVGVEVIAKSQAMEKLICLVAEKSLGEMT